MYMLYLLHDIVQKHPWGGGGGAEKMCATHITSVKSLTIRIQGLLKGPGSTRVLDALSYYLILLLKHSDTKRDTVEPPYKEVRYNEPSFNKVILLVPALYNISM